MFQRRIPEDLRHAPNPGMKGFALLAAIEAGARGVLTSVFPIAMYRSLGDAETVSAVYFVLGLLSMCAALLTPWVTRFMPRRFVYSAAVVLMMTGNMIAGTGVSVPLGLALNMIAVVSITVCFNAYVMDYVERRSLGRCETLRLFYSGAAWSIGPFLGVWLMDQWLPAPFILSNAICLALLVEFWILRLGNGRIITRARRRTTNPLGYLHRFIAQPRLVSGWLFAVVRSCGWWVFVVYLPIFAVESGYGEYLGGLALSLANGMLFLTPLMLRWMQARSVRQAVMTGFLGSAACFAGAALAGPVPLMAIGLLLAGSGFLVLLDVCGGLPFLMAVKPSERTEMSAVYSTFRDVSGVVTPAVAWAVLLVMPLPAVFAAAGAGLAYCCGLSSRLHPRMGRPRFAGT